MPYTKKRMPYTKDKYEDDSVTMSRQDWIVTAGDHFYLIVFGALPSVFDTPELTEVRDHLIKSIQFTSSNNATTKNSSNRFSRYPHGMAIYGT